MKKATEERIGRLLGRLDALVPEQLPAKLDAKCYRWKASPLGVGHLAPVRGWKPPRLGLLHGLDAEIRALDRNTAAFMAGRPANHALLTGPRGCGKTSVVHGVAAKHARKGLKVVRVARERIVELPELVDVLGGSEHRFLVICDELSFAGSDDGYIGAKAALDELDGGRLGMLVYATSNRRHLVPEDASENLEASQDESGEIHPGETTEEKISLSDRFGLWIPVFSPNEGEYLALVSKWFSNHGRKRVGPAIERASLLWAAERGSLNGRIARQFVEDFLESRRK